MINYDLNQLLFSFQLIINSHTQVTQVK